MDFVEAAVRKTKNGYEVYPKFNNRRSKDLMIRGGKFYGWNPSASYGEPGGPVSFVAEGYGVVESTEMIDGVEHKVFEVKPINE